MSGWLRRRPAQEEPENANTDAGPEQPPIELAAQITSLARSLMALERNTERSAREQFKANALSQEAISSTRAALERLTADVQTALNLISALTTTTASANPTRPSGSSTALNLPALRDGQPPPTGALSTPNAASSALRVVEALMPVLDAIEAGLASGRAQIELMLDEAARAVLTGWLEGQRLLRERLLSLLEREGVRPIPALGVRFDPYRHVAISTVSEADQPPGMIMDERRRGYEVEGRVLRFAEVVVNQPAPGAVNRLTPPPGTLAAIGAASQPVRDDDTPHFPADAPEDDPGAEMW